VSVDLYLDAPEDIEDLVLAWLLPLAGSPAGLGLEKPDGATFPFRMVTGLHTVDDCNLFASESLVSVHTFETHSNPQRARSLAKRAARDSHQRLLLLAHDAMPDVVMADGRLANVDYLEVAERPHYEDYRADNVKRYVGRYLVGLSFNAPPPVVVQALYPGTGTFPATSLYPQGA
jgi:hypothetical protein